MILAMVVLAPMLASVTDTDCKRCDMPQYSTRGTTMSRMMPQFIDEASKRTKITITSADKQAMVKIAYKESTWNPNAKTKFKKVRKFDPVRKVYTSRSTGKRISSAFGLFGFLDATWRNYGYTKTACPWCQTEAGLVYMTKRYGNPTKALRYHDRVGTY